MKTPVLALILFFCSTGVSLSQEVNVTCTSIYGYGVMGRGSIIKIKDEFVVLTCAHYHGLNELQSSEYKIGFPDGTQREASFLKCDKRLDIMLLRFTVQPSGSKHYELAKDEGLELNSMYRYCTYDSNGGRRCLSGPYIGEAVFSFKKLPHKVCYSFKMPGALGDSGSAVISEKTGRIIGVMTNKTSDGIEPVLIYVTSYQDIWKVVDQKEAALP